MSGALLSAEILTQSVFKLLEKAWNLTRYSQDAPPPSSPSVHTFPDYEIASHAFGMGRWWEMGQL